MPFSRLSIQWKITLLAGLCLLALSTSVAHAQQNMVSVAGSTLNMREGPGTGSPVLWARALQASDRARLRAATGSRMRTAAPGGGCPRIPAARAGRRESGVNTAACRSVARARAGNAAPSPPNLAGQRRTDVPNITMYTTAICPYCVAAKNFLKSRGASWEEVRIDLDPVAREQMMSRARRTSVPQIFIGETHVGGYDDLVALDRAGGLKPLLEARA